MTGLHEAVHRPVSAPRGSVGILSYIFSHQILCVFCSSGIALRKNHHTLCSSHLKVAICRVVCTTDSSSGTIVSIDHEAHKQYVLQHGISISVIRKSGLGQVKILTCLAKTSLKQQQRSRLSREAIYRLWYPIRPEKV